MRVPSVTRVGRRARRLAAAGALLLVFAAPFADTPVASAYPGYTATITWNDLSACSAGWNWYQGGVNGVLLARTTISLAPGSSVLVNLKGHAHTPCKYAPSGGNAQGDGVFTLQS